MSKPNMFCGECPYWLAYGEPETTDEPNEAILAHCKECDFDPDAVEELYKVMRGSVIRDNYDPYTGKYAFVSPKDDISNEECENTARSLIEPDGEICEAKELLARSLEQLYLLGYDSGFTNPEISALTTDIKKFLED